MHKPSHTFSSSVNETLLSININEIIAVWEIWRIMKQFCEECLHDYSSETLRSLMTTFLTNFKEEHNETKDFAVSPRNYDNKRLPLNLPPMAVVMYLPAQLTTVSGV